MEKNNFGSVYWTVWFNASLGSPWKTTDLPNAIFFHRILTCFFFFKHFSCPDVSSYSTITISYIKKEKNRLSQKARMILLKTIFLGFSWFPSFFLTLQLLPRNIWKHFVLVINVFGKTQSHPVRKNVYYVFYCTEQSRPLGEWGNCGEIQFNAFRS